MNQKKAKALRRRAADRTIGQLPSKTRAYYRELKKAAKLLARPLSSKGPTRRVAKPSDGYKLLKPARAYRPHGLIGRDPRREWTPGPLIIAKGLAENPRRVIGKLRFGGRRRKSRSSLGGAFIAGE